MKLALSAPSCVSFADALESGLTIVDLGSPPAGAERAQRFWAGILTGRITRAILSRPIRADSPQAWVIFEEVQEALGGGQAEQFARLLALARHKRIALTLVNQQPGQVASVDPTLVRVLRTNAGLEAAFRANLDDARALVHALPSPGAKRSAGEERLEQIAALTRCRIASTCSGSSRRPFGRSASALRGSTCLRSDARASDCRETFAK